MRVVSVNVGEPREIEHEGQTVSTGIYKTAIDERVMVRELGVDGDGQADLVNHGGVYKAVYFYPHEHYATWSQELKRDDFSYGQFGENITTEGLLEDAVHIGDTLRVGDALVQVTQPRMPCYKLGIRMNLPTIVKLFSQSLRCGWYARVLEEGETGAGDSITRENIDPQRVPVQSVFNLLLYDKDNRELAKRVLKVESLTPGWRADFEAMLR